MAVRNPETYQPRGYVDLRVPATIRGTKGRTASVSRFHGDCLTPDCEGGEITRGCCQNCYVRYARQVRYGEVTWGELEVLGMVRPSKRREK